MSDADAPTQTEIFASFAQSFGLNDVSAETISYTPLLVLDLLGCAIGVLGTPEEIAARKACLHMDEGTAHVSLWGTGLRAPPRNAAMFNGIISHVLELDDFLGIDHTGAVVLPALFAVMDHEGRFDEESFLEAMILGYEIGRRMLDTGGGYSTHNNAGWHTTGTLGAFSAAAATSKYLGLNAEHTVSAIGLSGSIAGGTWAFNADGSMSKRFHTGAAAQNGVVVRIWPAKALLVHVTSSRPNGAAILPSSPQTLIAIPARCLMASVRICASAGPASNLMPAVADATAPSMSCN